MIAEQQIKAVAEAIRSATARTTPFYDSANKILTRKTKQTISVATSVKAARFAIAAMQLREMTVEEIWQHILKDESNWLRMLTEQEGYIIRKALTKLGTIRIVEKDK